MARSTITDAEREFVETWQNIATFQNTIITLSTRGDEVHQVISVPNQNFTLTTQERMITQERIVDKKNDPFANGSFRPVIVPDSITIESNPNALADEEIEAILVSSEIAWAEYMKVIDSPATLTRMVDLAEGVDGVTLKRMRELETRLAEVRPKTRLTSNDPTLQRFMDRERSDLSESEKDQPELRGPGGRSKAYRPS